jgi:hypothetical protein
MKKESFKKNNSYEWKPNTIHKNVHTRSGSNQKVLY